MPSAVHACQSSTVLNHETHVHLLHVQGNCLQAPSDDILAAVGANAAPLRPLHPGQCLIMSDGDFLQVLSDRVLWVDNLYVRQSTAAGV